MSTLEIVGLVIGAPIVIMAGGWFYCRLFGWRNYDE